ncbi:unnamed protein product, partial [Rotaria sordida]
KNRLTCDQRLKSIILHKAALAYFCFVDRCDQDRNYRSYLRYLRLALNYENSSEYSWVFELTTIVERNLTASTHAYEYVINIIQNLNDYGKQRLHL